MNKWLSMGVLIVFAMSLVACQKDDMSTKKRRKRGSKSMAQSEKVIEREVEAVTGK